ncbi:alpha-L-arabinofuranosidase [Sporolactobacillus shoreicorticis]|uniref:non-reducing end alpha-L-arabinofuranosidase n=1 Tax=Sporolactobacillus shoreicorticis TaxID=1923877 RepID=A0ABW5S9G0_9BACL|nr:alpha-L-arabinofuranosidase C-terminal domain-containing protein [Sporolactobacillus shoreicorticis]MCO7127893.1 alpha-L-arabinofuranosidase [Sporolactobacillus shoreicorticis]
MRFIAGNQYNLTFFAQKINHGSGKIQIVLSDDQENTLSNFAVIQVTAVGWNKYRAVLTATQTTLTGRLSLYFEENSQIALDMVSLFPEETFMHRKNGVRNDLGQVLKALHPKFIRFPGGCLVHDGTLNAEDRESMYRWKNSIVPIEERPVRRNKWGYNQTLGLGFYEYFQLAEDIGAKPLPVLPGGYDPHHKRAVPIDQLGEWIDDALDLIEFANGDEKTKWGKFRTDLGHPAPFHLEYLAIGNEEVGQPFFDRYPYFHKAIKAKYPEIKLINTSGPFSAGSEFDRGWRSAKENHSDLIDEHYYMAPEWFLANHHRYDNYDPKGPKVFLGEYASEANKWYNAVVEASYMLGLERNAAKVGLACYAPLLANSDYINWQPDLIFFNQHTVTPSVNYYVQQLFMKYQGTQNVGYQIDQLPRARIIDDRPIIGEFGIEGDLADVRFDDVTFEANGETRTAVSGQISDRNRIKLGHVQDADYTISFTITKTGGRMDKGVHFYFGQSNIKNHFVWILGGWENQDSIIMQRKAGDESVWCQCQWHIEMNRQYHCRIRVAHRRVTAWIDDVKYNDILIKETKVAPIYSNVTYDAATNQYYLKVVNVTDVPQALALDPRYFAQGILHRLSGQPNVMNRLGEVNQLTVEDIHFEDPTLTIPAYSVNVLVSGANK